MKTIKEEHQGIATILSLALIPLSGFATDIYVPSLPAMTVTLHATNAQVQLSILIFLVSAGLTQLFVGPLLDSFGRYRLSNAALIAFSMSCFVIAWIPNLFVLYLMRVIHGISVALIVVSKRAYFIDCFSGDRLKKYVSMFSIIWATAPIVAPFLGGYLQDAFGWQSNFYLLGSLTLIILALTLKYGGESIKTYHPFELKPIMRVYVSMLTTKDYAIGLMILGLSYSMVMVFGLTSPFIIEHVWHHSPVVTGYSSLFSGAALMTGAIISKSMITKPLNEKIPRAIALQLCITVLMIVISWLYLSNIYLMVSFVILLHMVVGFVFNNLFVYALGRFSNNAGILSGLTGGGFYVITSVFSYGIVNILSVKNQVMLGSAYLVLILINSLMYLLFRKEQVHPSMQYKYKLS